MQKKVKSSCRICNVCGCPCRGHECWDCYSGKKYSGLSRQRARKHYYDKNKIRGDDG